MLISKMSETLALYDKTEVLLTVKSYSCLYYIAHINILRIRCLSAEFMEMMTGD